MCHCGHKENIKLHEAPADDMEGVTNGDNCTNFMVTHCHNFPEESYIDDRIKPEQLG